jgi:class 3 adenylate cyclase
MEHWDDAEKRFRDAIAFCERMPSPSYLAQTQYNYAQMLLRRGADGDRQHAIELLSTAGEAAQRMGMVRLAGLAVEAKAKAQGIGLGDIKTSIDAVLESVEEEAPDLRAYAAAGGTLTIMFTDIEGHTEVAERLGDRGYMTFLREHNALVRSQLEQHGGLEVKNDGDGFMVVFQDARAGLRCAMGIQSALNERGVNAEPMNVRIGLHAGEVVEENADFFGRNVILAARVAALATGGETLVSEAVRRLAEDADEFRFGEPRQVKLKGLSGDHEVSPLLR